MERPLLIDWSFTARCNLTCPFCRGYASTELDATNALQLAAQIAALEPGRVILEGGEPFLRGDLPEVIRVLTEAGIPTTIFTNGTAVRFDWLDRLGSASVDVAVSVDAEEPALYQTLRPGADQQSVWRNIHQLGDAGKLSGVVITASKLNLADVLHVIDRARAAGVPSATVIPIKPSPLYAQLRLTAAQKAELYRQIAAYRQRVGYAVFVDEPFFEPCFGHAEVDPSGPVAAATAGCVFGRYMFIAADGQVAPCTFADFFLGSVADKPLSALWKALVADPRVRAARDLKRRVPPLGGQGDGCGACPDAESCGGCRVVSAAAARGDLCASDPNCPRNW